MVFIKNQLKNDLAILNCNDIGDAGCIIIAESISSKSCKVKELRVSKCNINDEGARLLFKALESNNSISILNLSKNYISEKAFENMNICFKINKTLKSIVLNNNKFTKEKAKNYLKNPNKISIQI